MATPGRPPKPLDPDASMAASLGAELRARRQERGLTLKALGDLIGFSPQHVSEVERANTPPSAPFVAACDSVLAARGRLLALLPAVLDERVVQRDERVTARRAGLPALRAQITHREGGDPNVVDPFNRRGLLGAGAAAALGGLSAGAAPAAAREIDPELVAHWTKLLRLLGRHDAMYGPHEVLHAVRHEMRLIEAHQQVARGRLRTQLLRVEADWTGFATWLSHDAGQWRSRDVLTNRALRLAKEADYRDMVAFAQVRRSQWAAQEAVDARRVIAFAEAGLRVPGAHEQTRAICAIRAALGHALANDTTACERSLAHAAALMENTDSPTPPWARGPVDASYFRTAEARCWLWMQPRKAVLLYEGILREWPHDRARDAGLHQARLALACARAGERDRAKAEGRKALAITRTTKSSIAARELRRLAELLRAR